MIRGVRMNIQVVFPVLISFAISVILGPIVIPFLRRLKMGQTERVEGVQSHLKKAGTPTMGGVIFLIAAVVTTLFYAKDYPNVIPVLFLTLGFGIIGFLDDYLKVVLRRSDGLLAWQKFGLQVVVTGIFVYYILNYTNVDLAMRIPFWPNHYLNLGWLAIPVLFFAVIGTVNGVNFTDGLDGLASSVTLIVAVFFTVVSIGMGSGIEPVTGAVVGGLMGFLLFNVYPARVFMGDTGSLALGGFVAGAAYMMQMPLFILLGILIGYFALPKGEAAWLDTLLTVSLFFLYTGAGIILGTNKEVFTYIKKLGLRILFLPLSIFVGCLLGGFLMGVLLDVPLKWSVLSASGMGYYSMSGAFLTEAYGIEAGVYGFIVNVSRDVFTVALLPLLAKISKGSPIASGAGGCMDTMLIPVSKAVGPELGLVALISGTITTLAVPIWLPLGVALFG